MVLEAVMILVDNSESSRNGDYQPTRFEAQADAVNILFQSVTSSNPESSVGMMSVGCHGPEMLTTLTTDRGKILDGLHRTKNKIGGPCHLWNALHVAFLGLKHRQNRLQRQRIVAFVCSPPVEQEARKLKDLALKFKKNNVSVDLVLFGDVEEDEDARRTLDGFVAQVRGDKSEGAQIVSIKPSSKLLSDQLLGTPILGNENMSGGGRSGAGAGGGSGGGGGAAGATAGVDEYGEFDFDPAMEPELALALRMSMEEEKARQERVAKEQEDAAKKESLGTVKEGDEEDQPLLAKDGSPAAGKEDDDKKGGNKRGDGKTHGDDDKMDTS